MDDGAKMEKTKQQKDRWRAFSVTPGIVGWKIVIGCTEAYFGSAEDCRMAIDQYLTRPRSTEEIYMQNDQRFNGPTYQAVQDTQPVLVNPSV
jgi:lipopolysaccharide/colanic/teichoic acid biosynthesis glycosyltransferase